jgi:hypothetical protein
VRPPAFDCYEAYPLQLGQCPPLAGLTDPVAFEHPVRQRNRGVPLFPVQVQQAQGNAVGLNRRHAFQPIDPSMMKSSLLSGVARSGISFPPGGESIFMED